MPKYPRQKNSEDICNYSCDFVNCNREFNSKRNLVDHCRGHHEGKKPHMCSYPGCGKSFLRPAHLLIHNRIHTGEKPFVCEYEGCGKRWNQKSALKQHIRSHTGEKPFKCTIGDCNKKFSTSSSCKRHVSTHFADDNNRVSNNSSGELSNLSSPSLSPTLSLSPSSSSTFPQYTTWSSIPFMFDSPSHSSSSDEEVDTALLSNFKYGGDRMKEHFSYSIITTPKMNVDFLLN